MNILKLTTIFSQNQIRINASAIVSYHEDSDSHGAFTKIITTEDRDNCYEVLETPEQIDKMLLDMGVKICP